VYTLTVTNLGPAIATGVQVTDPLPSGVTFVSATPSQGTCTGGTTVSCDLGTVASGSTATISIVVHVGIGGPLVNRATVSGNEPDPNGSNDSSTAITAIEGSSIPTLSGLGLLVLAAGLLGVARLLLRGGE
jgi:uncharacterized repeat protein (TIGR01451 family)